MCGGYVAHGRAHHIGSTAHFDNHARSQLLWPGGLVMKADAEPRASGVTVIRHACPVAGGRSHD